MNKSFDLLKALYEIHSPSEHEEKMRTFLVEICQQYGACVSTDEVGNVYAVKGEAETYPCICAHMDQVQATHSEDFTVMYCEDIVFAFSPMMRSQEGLGADDKNGIWIALHLLKNKDVMKCAFFVGEEIGCVGSGAADMNFFSDVRFVIEPDRRNGGDLITSIGDDICSREFVEAINPSRFGYKEATGLMTDVEELCSNLIGVSCINFSCGYYFPHTDHEVTSWSELCNALDFAEYIVDNCTDVYPFEYNPRYGRNWHSPRHIIDSYTAFDRAYDYETMSDILSDCPHLLFHELYSQYKECFITQDVDILNDMYDECSQIIYDDVFRNGDESGEYFSRVVDGDDELETNTWPYNQVAK